MTETRIRWEPNGRDTGWCGFVGTMKPWAFQIWHAGTPGNPWRLDSALLGQFGYHVDHPDPDALKRHAGRWLEEFTASLGAVFPGGHPDGNAIEAYCATGAGDGDGRHLLQYAVRLPGGTTTAYGDQSWVSAGLGARDAADGASTVVRDIWLSYGPWRTHETTAATTARERE